MPQRNAKKEPLDSGNACYHPVVPKSSVIDQAIAAYVRDYIFACRRRGQDDQHTAGQSGARAINGHSRKPVGRALQAGSGRSGADCQIMHRGRETWRDQGCLSTILAMPNPAHEIRLHWPGRAEAKALPAATLETLRAGNPAVRLIHGDNLGALSALRRCDVRAQLIYLDPPFFTGREHAHVERSRGKDGIVRRLVPAFDDRWSSLEHYLGELALRVRLARELLDPSGCLVLHVDPKTSHYAKVLCDEIFGARAFASEIIWRYRRWPAKTQNFQRVHDVLLRYVRDPEQEPRFRQLYEPLAPSTAKTWGTRRQRAVVDASGRRRRSSVTEELSKGAPLGDVWDISIIAPVARERTGYPTQKPEALLERLVETCTEPGDLVLDAYCGSGTTLAVCSRLGRRAIGIDQSPQALEITRQRLEKSDVSPREERVAHGRRELGRSRPRREKVPSCHG